jgi:gag-polypeptide of LTR copia-type
MRAESRTYGNYSAFGLFIEIIPMYYLTSVFAMYPIVEHINKLREKQYALISMGERISDQEFKSILIMSLPDTWESFTSSYQGSNAKWLRDVQQPQAQAQMSSQELSSVLIQEYYRRRQDDQSNNSNVTYSAQQGAPPKKRKFDSSSSTPIISRSAKYAGVRIIKRRIVVSKGSPNAASVGEKNPISYNVSS